MKYFWVLTTIVSLLFSLLGSSSAEQCGWQANNTLCPYEACCSSHGFCGNTPAYCGVGCQSQCNETQVPIPLQKPKFEKMLMHRNDNACPASGFYTYEAFITAAQEFPAFGTTGDLATREREIAAFFGQTSHETTGGWPDAPDGPYAWGYCFLTEVNPPSDYCSPTGCECAPGKTYIGRGPIQLSWNYNYCPCGEALNVDLENYPELVETDPVLAFKTALWFWMTPQPPKPSCHDVITGSWIPTPEDLAANRTSGYGLITNIINGGIECGKGPNDAGENRIGFYKRYSTMIGVDMGDNLDCYYQRPYGPGPLLNTM